MKKRILSLALASAMAVGTVSGAFAETEATTKTNVPYIQGNQSGEFMPNSDITRQEIAVMIGKALELEGSNPDFKDADKIAAWADEFVAGLQDAEIVEGDEAGNFNPTNKITRAELATMVVRAYESVTGEELSEGDTSFDDVADSAWYASAVKKAAEAGLVLGDGTGNFNPAGNATRAQTVVMVNRMLGLGEDNLPSNVAEVLETELNDSDEWPSWAVDAILVASTAFEYTVGEDGKIVIKGEEEELAVESVSAINATTLEIKGAALGELAAADITVADNTVSSVTASEDGKTATVVLGTILLPGSESKVTVKIGEETKEFTVSYEVEASTVEVVAGTFDDDTKGQKISFKVDGAIADIDYLRAAGYTVEFNAVDDTGAQVNATFFNAAGLNLAGLSTDGKLNELATIAEGDYKVSVTLTKGSDIVTSPQAAIKIMNLDNAATTIDSVEFINDLGGANEFIHNSNKLVIGETVDINKLVVSLGSSKTEIANAGTYKVESSNANISVDAGGQIMTAESLGTADITITVGSATKKVTLEVVGTARKVSKAAAGTTTKNLIVGNAATETIKITDQYGDPVPTGAGSGLTALGDVAVEYPSAVTLAGSDTTLDDADVKTINKGEYTLTIGTPDTAGKSGTIVFKDKDNNVIGSLIIRTETGGIANRRLDIAPTSESKDDVIEMDIASDDKATYRVGQYNSAGTFVSAADLTIAPGHTVKFNKDIVTVAGDTTGEVVLAAGNTVDAGTGFEVVGVKAGSTTIAIYNTDGVLVGSRTVTVKKTSTSISGVAWKTVPTIDYVIAGPDALNYKDVLDITEGVTVNDIVKGITLSEASLHKVRIDSTNGQIYLDRNDNGANDDGASALIGTLEYRVSSDATGGLLATAGQDGLDAIAGTTLAAPSKGTVTFYIIDETSTSRPVIATKSVLVDIK